MRRIAQDIRTEALAALKTMTLSQASEKFKVSKTTLGRWRDEEKYKAALLEAKKESPASEQTPVCPAAVTPVKDMEPDEQPEEDDTLTLLELLSRENLKLSNENEKLREALRILVH